MKMVLAIVLVFSIVGCRSDLRETKKPTKKETMNFIRSIIAEYESPKFTDEYGEKITFRLMCDVTTITLSDVDCNGGSFKSKTGSTGIWSECLSKYSYNGHGGSKTQYSVRLKDDKNTVKLDAAWKHLADLKQAELDSINF